MENSKAEKYKKIFDKTTSSDLIHEGVLLIENIEGDFSYSHEYGGKNIDSSMVMASITKLFTTTCILTLLEQGKLSLNDKISKYLDGDILSGLHIFNGKEYSFDLIVSDLLFQTSGLPDAYEEGKDSLKNKLINSDHFLSFNEMIALNKKLKPHFAPRTGNKAYYSDMNFDLLGKIIEKAASLPLVEAFRTYIFEPIKLVNTYFPENDTYFIPGVYNKDTILYRPQFLRSSLASGGCITTAVELMKFIKAFFEGTLFDKIIFEELSNYNKLQSSMGPIYYGGGYMQIPLNGLYTMFMGKGELIGHSGSTGSFAFYYPDKGLYFVGDLNQMSNPAIPIRLTMQLAMVR